MRGIQCIENVCWNKINKLQWSAATNILYCICGDIEQSLKAYDPAEFGQNEQPSSLINANTTKELIFGFVINPKPSKAYFDEFIIFGKRKFCHCGIVQKGTKLVPKIKAVPIAAFQGKDGERR